MRFFIFLVGLSLLLVGISSYFGGTPIPIDVRTYAVTIGTAKYGLDVVFIIFGVLLMLLSVAMNRAKTK